MLKKRIIPCLDIKDGRTVKGVNFVDIRDAGDPIELAKRYVQDGADELVFLDITATIEKRKTLAELVEKIAKEINIPFTVGGGINSLEDAKAVIKAGADKVSINSSAVKNPSLISEIANEFGSQCVVVAIDTKFEKDEWTVFVSGGKIPTGIKTLDWAKQVEALGPTPSPADVEAILPGWTRMECTECNQDSEQLIQVGQEPDYDSATAFLCWRCAINAVALFKLP
jgi:cyclase